MEMAVFWVVASCSLVEVYLRFRAHRPDDGASKHLWNVCKLLPDYTAQQLRRQPSSYLPPWEPQISLRYHNGFVSEVSELVGFEVLTAVSTKMAVFWVVAPFSLVEVYQLIALMMEAARTSETSVNFYQTTRRYNPEDSHLRVTCRLKFKLTMWKK
jgi:hypothetical protein